MMLRKFNAYIDQHKLCRKSDKIMLAVSGGIDSMVMADLFAKSGYNIRFLHCNFRLRGDESDKDEALVAKVAKSYNIPVEIKKFDTKGIAEKRQLSIQLAARELRYGWFNSLLSQNPTTKLATAHHLNDQLETVLFYLAKGSGIKGIAGIPVKSGKIIRPLLFATRNDILHYAKENNIQWREDASNMDTKYKRNYIRHQLIPSMQHLNPSLFETFGRTAKRLAESRDLLINFTYTFKKDFFTTKGQHIFIDKKNLTSRNATFLHLLLEDFGINYQQSEDLFKAINENATGAVFHTKTHYINIDRQLVLISPQLKDFKPFFIDDKTMGHFHPFVIEKIKKEEAVLVPDPNIAFLDYDKLRFPLVVRRWKEGDRFVPLGMKRQKKLSDFMIDNKIAVNLKDRQMVLESGEDIVWVIGQRIDDRYKMTENTKMVYRIKWSDEKPV